MSVDQGENFSSTFSTDNFGSTGKLTEKHPEEEYDPYKNREVEHPNTFWGALTHLLKSSLGSGVLAIPHAIATTGILVGTIGTVSTGILATHTVHLLVSASQRICKKVKKPSLGFAETVYAVFENGPEKVRLFSNSASIFVEVALLLTYYATIAVYVVFVSTSIQQLVNYYHPDVSEWPVQYYMLMILIPLIILCQIRQLKHLVPFSFVANLSMIVAFIITLYYMFSGDVDVKNRKLFTTISGIPLFFSIVLFAMEGIGTMLPIENSMLKQQFLGCPGVLNFGMGFVTTLYILIGLFGYLRFGDKVQANVIADLPVDEIPAQVAKMCITVTVFFTCLLQFYVPCFITWDKLRLRISEQYHNVSQIILRMILVIFITAIAAAVPKLGPIISLVGSIFLSTLGLAVPATIDIVVILGEDRNFGYVKWKLWKNIFIICLAFFALGSGSYYAVQDLIED